MISVIWMPNCIFNRLNSRVLIFTPVMVCGYYGEFILEVARLIDVCIIIFIRQLGEEEHTGRHLQPTLVGQLVGNNFCVTQMPNCLYQAQVTTSNKTT